jgi:hypothetical protein
MTLAEVYASMDKENVHQFLVSPYTAKLPGALYTYIHTYIHNIIHLKHAYTHSHKFIHVS